MKCENLNLKFAAMGQNKECDKAKSERYPLTSPRPTPQNKNKNKSNSSTFRGDVHAFPTIHTFVMIFYDCWQTQNKTTLFFITSYII
jgi:hypothetical protein